MLDKSRLERPPSAWSHPYASLGKVVSEGQKFDWRFTEAVAGGESTAHCAGDIAGEMYIFQM
jgi:hypothetical protein